jgi:hypothetical protein
MYILSPITYCQSLKMTLIVREPRHVHTFTHNKPRSSDAWRCQITLTCTYVRLQQTSSSISNGPFTTILQKGKRERMLMVRNSQFWDIFHRLRGNSGGNSWFRHYTTSRKVACSIPDGVIGIFHWHNHSGRTVTLGSTQPLTEMGTRNISWG